MMPHGLILAAGLGTRMGALTESRPKCLVELCPGESILDRALRTMRPYVQHTRVVAGYLAGIVSDHVAGVEGVSVTINSQYRQLSNTASLEVGLKALPIDTPILLVEGDIVFDGAICEAVLSRCTDCTSLNRWTSEMEGSFVTLDANNLVATWTHAQHLYMDRAVTGAERFKTINISFLTPTFVKGCLQLIDQVPRLRSLPIEILFDHMLQNGYQISGVINEGFPWCEIDNDEDLQLSRKMLL